MGEFQIRSRFDHKGSKWEPWRSCNGPGFQQLVLQAEWLFSVGRVDVVTIKTKGLGTFQIRRTPAHNDAEATPSDRGDTGSSESAGGVAQ